MKLLLNFLQDLERNNNREWFSENKSTYEKAKEQMLHATELLLNEIGTFDKTIGEQNPKDCMFRIYRDVRFSGDKRPYKTHMGSQITPGGKKSIYPGYYLHIDANNSFIAGGLWQPEKQILQAMRREIKYDATEFRQILNNQSFVKYFPQMVGEKLKTAPKGFDKNHPDIDLLRYKDYIFSYPLKSELISSGEFMDECIDACKQLYKVNSYIRNVIFDLETEN